MNRALVSGGWGHFRQFGVYLVTSVAIAGALLVEMANRTWSTGMLEFAGLLFAAGVNAALDHQKPGLKDRRAPLSFMIDFATMMLVGPLAAALVAAVGAVLHAIDDDRITAAGRIAGSTVAIQVAGSVYFALGGTGTAPFAPLQLLLVAVSVAVYSATRSGVAEHLVPLLFQRRLRGASAWLRATLDDAPDHVLGAVFAVALVGAIVHQMLTVLLAAAVTHVTYRCLCAHLNRRERDRRHREVLQSMDKGMCQVDSDGIVTVWNDAMADMMQCPRERALGSPILLVLPAAGQPDVARAMTSTLQRSGEPATGCLSLRSPDGARIFSVTVMRHGAGATICCADVTQQRRAEEALKQREERLALIEAGVNDGLWEWDLRTSSLYLSGRWKAMLGLPAEAGTVRPDDWFARVHPEDLGALKDAIDAHVAGLTQELNHEYRMRHENGSYRRVLCRGVAVRSGRRRPARMAGSLTDVTEWVQAREGLRNAGALDPLTGLSNRAVFVQALGRRLDQLKAHGGGFAVLYLDLDRFKVVNDSLGHLVGDELLVAVSRRLESCLRDGDALARLGGDEFAICLNDLVDEGQANAIAFRIQDALGAPFAIAGREVFTSASIGIAFGRATYKHPEDVMRDADTAMYHAKARGKARHELFDAEMHARALDRLGLESDLRHAVKNHDFEVFFQPIVSLNNGAWIGFESLVRWSRNGMPVSPDKFIPIAEELGLIESLGMEVLCNACQTFADWQRRYPASGLECITVNVSTRQLVQHNFVHVVEQAVERAGLAPSHLRLEITETALMDNPHVVAAVLRDLRDFGVKIYLDDFGTGYSSLSHLHKLPVDALKIDRSFVRSLLLPDRPAIVESILALARTLETGVVAEGVESADQAAELRALGCRHAQGYLFSPAIPKSAVEKALREQKAVEPFALRASAPARGDVVPFAAALGLSA